MGKLTRYEQETIINYNQEEDLCHCYTHDPRLMRKLDDFAQKSSVITVVKKGEDFGEYTYPKKWVKVRFPRELSEEKRKLLSEQAKRNLGRGKSE